MARAPEWLQALVSAGTARSEAALFVGPLLPLKCDATLDFALEPALAPAGPYDALFVASATGALGPMFRGLRSRCRPGASIHVLLPVAEGGLGRRLARVFDPLGRVGRTARSTTEICGAMLAMGAVRVERCESPAAPTYVRAWVPDTTDPLDAAFR